MRPPLIRPPSPSEPSTPAAAPPTSGLRGGGVLAAALMMAAPSAPLASCHWSLNTRACSCRVRVAGFVTFLPFRLLATDGGASGHKAYPPNRISPGRHDRVASCWYAGVFNQPASRRVMVVGKGDRKRWRVPCCPGARVLPTAALGVMGKLLVLGAASSKARPPSATDARITSPPGRGACGKSRVPTDTTPLPRCRTATPPPGRGMLVDLCTPDASPASSSLLALSPAPVVGACRSG